MRVCFPRLPDGQRAWCLVDRTDGVRYRVREGLAGRQLPHDLVHLVVERELDERGGFWGAVAAGAVFGSMEHVHGRRRPHAADRSKAALRERRADLLRAELMADLVRRVADGGITEPGRVRKLARDVLSLLPDPVVDAKAVIAAARELDEMGRRWAALEVGDELVVEWDA